MNAYQYLVKRIVLSKFSSSNRKLEIHLKLPKILSSPDLAYGSEGDFSIYYTPRLNDIYGMTQEEFSAMEKSIRTAPPCEIPNRRSLYQITLRYQLEMKASQDVLSTGAKTSKR